MPTITAQYLGDYRVESVHEQSSSLLVTDAPTDNNGKGEAFSPTDLCAAALGACALTIMDMYAKNHGFDITGTTIETQKVMSANPRRISAIEIVFTMPDRDFTEHQKTGLQRAALTCPVHQSLHPDMEKKFTFKWAK